MAVSVRKNGFTLIELLVVIGIISLLVAIVFPSFARARQIAKRSACAVTIKGLGHALQLYRGDFKHFPNACMMPSVDPTGVPIWEALEGYASGKENFLCAADKGPVDPTSADRTKYGNKRYWDIEGTSYEYREHLSNESRYEHIIERVGAERLTMMNCFDYFHGGKGQVNNRNFVFADGHVGDIVDESVEAEIAEIEQ